jgi:hypothetical protein
MKCSLSRFSFEIYNIKKNIGPFLSGRHGAVLSFTSQHMLPSQMRLVWLRSTKSCPFYLRLTTSQYLKIGAELSLELACLAERLQKELTIKIVQFVGIEAVMGLVAAPLKLELVADPE